MKQIIKLNQDDIIKIVAEKFHTQSEHVEWCDISEQDPAGVITERVEVTVKLYGYNEEIRNMCD